MVQQHWGESQWIYKLGHTPLDLSVEDQTYEESNVVATIVSVGMHGLLCGQFTLDPAWYKQGRRRPPQGFWERLILQTGNGTRHVWGACTARINKGVSRVDSFSSWLHYSRISIQSHPFIFQCHSACDFQFISPATCDKFACTGTLVLQRSLMSHCVAAVFSLETIHQLPQLVLYYSHRFRDNIHAITLQG